MFVDKFLFAFIKIELEFEFEFVFWLELGLELKLEAVDMWASDGKRSTFISCSEWPTERHQIMAGNEIREEQVHRDTISKATRFGVILAG